MLVSVSLARRLLTLPTDLTVTAAGRMRDDLQTLRDKTTALELKIDREVNEVKTLVERTKTDTTRYTVYLISAAAGVIFTLSRLVGVL